METSLWMWDELYNNWSLQLFLLLYQKFLKAVEISIKYEDFYLTSYWPIMPVYKSILQAGESDGTGYFNFNFERAMPFLFCKGQFHLKIYGNFWSDTKAKKKGKRGHGPHTYFEVCKMIYTKIWPFWGKVNLWFWELSFVLIL